jgi:hypothetical protein
MRRCGTTAVAATFEMQRCQFHFFARACSLVVKTYRWPPSRGVQHQHAEFDNHHMQPRRAVRKYWVNANAQVTSKSLTCEFGLVAAIVLERAPHG